MQTPLTLDDFNFIIVDDIQGAAEAAAFLEKKENTLMELHDFLTIAIQVVQFDWGDFFLFQEIPKNWTNFQGELYPHIIAQTDTTIRAIDDTYVYVYTPYQEIVNIIKENYEIESIKTDSLDNLDYPY